MVERDPEAAPAHRSAQEILAHPRYPAARKQFVDAILEIYEDNPRLSRLLVEAGRGVLFIVIVALHARCDEGVRATWPTMGLVTQAMMTQGVTSARRISALVSRLVETGYVEMRLAPQDRRVRILTPTAKMLAQDQDWLIAHYRPLQTLFADPGYDRILRRDPAFHLAHRLVTAEFFALGAKIMADHPAVMLFMSREGGIMVLIKLIQLCDPDGAEAPREVSFTDMAARFGVSRTQVRKVLEDAGHAGLLSVTTKGRQFVALTPDLVAAFDRFLAAGMSGHDLIYSLTQRATPPPGRDN